MTMEIGSDTRSISTGNGQGKIKLLTRQSLDGRTRARKQFDRIVVGITNDLGGERKLSTIQRELIEAFAGVMVHVHDLNAKLLLGQDVDSAKHSHTISDLVRIASRLPIDRVPPADDDDPLDYGREDAS